MRLRYVVPAVLAGGVGAGAVAISNRFDVPIQYVPELVARSGRTFWAGAKISLRYKLLPAADESLQQTAEYKAMLSSVHQKGADEMLSVCRKNKGVFTKLGQHIASLVHIVPKEYVTTLAVLQDKAPFMPIAEVETVLREELGADWRRHFEHFDDVPIAVHYARLASGREVAVKVQYPSVRRQLHMDLATITGAVKIIGRLFPKFEFSWILPEFKIYINEELNFEMEAANNAKIRKLFEDEPQFATPEVIKELSTKKLMVMEYIHGVKVDNVAAIEKMGFDKTEVARLLIENFSDQIFVGGFLHADPHPGNVFVRPITLHGRSRPQIVLLDHGLYRQLSPEFCDNYSRLWKALVVRDRDAIEKYARALGAGDYYKIFAFILTMRPVANSNVGLRNKVTKADWEQVRREWEEADPAISRFLEGLDRELLLVLRSGNILRSINVALGSQVNRYHVAARSAIKGIHFRRTQGMRNAGWGAWLAYSWDLVRLDFALFVANILGLLKRVEMWIVGAPEEELAFAERVA